MKSRKYVQLLNSKQPLSVTAAYIHAHRYTLVTYVHGL